MDTKRLLLVGGMLVAAGVVFFQVKKMGTAPAPAPTPVVDTRPVEPTIINEVDYQDILVASKEIQFGERITSGSLEWMKWPEEALSSDFIVMYDDATAAEDLVGQVANAAIYTGEPINRRKLIDTGDQSLMAALITPGMRAVSQRINVTSAAGGFIQPGDRVDVVLTSEVQQQRFGAGQAQANRREYVSGAILENVRVLAIDQIFGKNSATGASITGSTATLELTPSDAEILLTAQSSGDIALVLRGISNRKGTVRSSASRKKDKSSNPQTVMVYRNGDQQQVAVRGQ